MLDFLRVKVSLDPETGRRYSPLYELFLGVPKFIAWMYLTIYPWNWLFDKYDLIAEAEEKGDARLVFLAYLAAYLAWMALLIWRNGWFLLTMEVPYKSNNKLFKRW